MRRMVLAIALGVVVAACGGSAGGTGDPSAPPGGDADPGATLAPPDGGDSGTGGMPSGAKVRIFNAYADPDGTPVALDVYPEPWVLEGATPLLTVEYGTLSPVFDPTVADDAGDMFLSAYAKGETGNGNSLMSVTQTLTGNEVITYVVAAGTGTTSSGRAGSISQSWFDPSVAGTDGATPAPGKGRVIVSAVGLDNVLSGDESWYASFGDGCTLGIGDDASTRSLVSPGTSGAAYDLDPGTHPFSLHPYDPSTATPACSGTPRFDGGDVAVTAGQTSVLFLYAATPDDLRAVVLPLAAP